ncbi:MAG: radical SAM protein [Candidatus Micrarchaeia archaeon]
MADVINENIRKEQIEVSAHEGLGILPNALKELWIEIGGSCHLRCKYCFAESGGIDRCKENLAIGQILGFLNEFAEMGGERIGIVGAGEPFHPENIEDLFEILEWGKINNIKITVFTSGDLITEKILDRLDNYKNIVLLIKFNSQIAEIQDELVNSKKYTERRTAAMNRLISRGYNDGKRLGIVTSIMEVNQNEMATLLRFARRNNLIFDADTIIPRGRGGSCGLSLSPEKTMEIVTQLQKIDAEEFGNVWEITSNYIASPPCTRFNQHMYISKAGLVHPCVASIAVVLGNIKEQKLQELWDGELMRIIRDHKYIGKCTTCENFNTDSKTHLGRKCYSCLGRSTEDLTTEFLKTHGYVKTKGCFNYRPMNRDNSTEQKQKLKV